MPESFHAIKRRIVAEATIAQYYLYNLPGTLKDPKREKTFQFAVIHANLLPHRKNIFSCIMVDQIGKFSDPCLSFLRSSSYA